MKNHVLDPVAAFRITWTNSTGSNITSGRPVKIHGHYYVAITDIANGAAGVLERCGVYEFPKATGGALTQGQAVGWDAGNSRVDSTVANGQLGFVYEAAGTNDTIVKVLVTTQQRIFAKVVDPSAGEESGNTMDVDTGWGIVPTGPVFVTIYNSSNQPRAATSVTLLTSTDAGKIRIAETNIVAGDLVHIFAALLPVWS